MGELVYALPKCRYNDTDAFGITLKTGEKRYKQVLDLTDTAERTIINNQSVAGQPYFRHMEQVVPEAGFGGDSFSMLLEKKLATGGQFEYDGVDYAFIPRGSLTPEFVHGGGTIANGW